MCRCTIYTSIHILVECPIVCSTIKSNLRRDFLSKIHLNLVKMEGGPFKTIWRGYDKTMNHDFRVVPRVSSWTWNMELRNRTNNGKCKFDSLTTAVQPEQCETLFIYIWVFQKRIERGVNKECRNAARALSPSGRLLINRSLIDLSQREVLFVIFNGTFVRTVG